MPNPALPSDLADRDYTGTASERAQQTRLDEAWRALRHEVGNLEARLDAGLVESADVVDVLCAAVLRVLRNPEGFEKESRSIDDYSESMERADASADLYFTAAELRRLRGTPINGPVQFSGSLRYC